LSSLSISSVASDIPHASYASYEALVKFSANVFGNVFGNVFDNVSGDVFGRVYETSNETCG
jgi:hypothetical protein